MSTSTRHERVSRGGNAGKDRRYRLLATWRALGRSKKSDTLHKGARIRRGFMLDAILAETRVDAVRRLLGHSIVSASRVAVRARRVTPAVRNAICQRRVTTVPLWQ